MELLLLAFGSSIIIREAKMRMVVVLGIFTKSARESFFSSFRSAIRGGPRSSAGPDAS